MTLLNYLTRTGFNIDVGFVVNATHISQAVALSNESLLSLPQGLYQSLDYKTTSAIVGSLFSNHLASITEGMVNPIEKGHPDIIPLDGKMASEAELHNYPEGIEIKCTIGNIQKGANLRAGEKRIGKLTGISWQAHHREVHALLGLVWDFLQAQEHFLFPALAGVYYADDLTPDDWGQISGTTGRNTKVTGMTRSGKRKMADGCLAVIDDPQYRTVYSRLLS